MILYVITDIRYMMSILKKIFEYIGLFLLLVLAIAIGTLIAYVVWISIHPQPPWLSPSYATSRLGIAYDYLLYYCYYQM